MLLLIDIGNTHTHIGLANSNRVFRQHQFPTADWFRNLAERKLKNFVGRARLDGIAMCSVVPRATRLASQAYKRLWKLSSLELNHRTLRGVGIDFPKPQTIGPDRLANAVAAQAHFGAPVIAIDFGTAVTFDVVDRKGNFVGGVIAPGLAAMTNYLHENTALLPRIKLREIGKSIGKSTEQAMLIGAVHGYRGLIRELLIELKRTLRARRLPVVATGGYAQLLASKIPEITAVDPLLTLEGLRLVWEAHATSRLLNPFLPPLDTATT
jgi:type III pantothenate kinase